MIFMNEWEPYYMFFIICIMGATWEYSIFYLANTLSGWVIEGPFVINHDIVVVRTPQFYI